MSTYVIQILFFGVSVQLFQPISFGNVEAGKRSRKRRHSWMNMIGNNSTDVNVTSMDKNPFENMKISENWKSLSSIQGRTLCTKCQKSRKYFCYTCYVAVKELSDIVPKVKLPVKVDIIKHAHEIDGKSTAVHAAILAPDDVTIHTYPCVPDYSQDENVVLIFPSKEATSLKEYIHKLKYQEKRKYQTLQTVKNDTNLCVPITRAVFIDSTWNQCKGIYKDPKLQALPCVILKSRLSQFWRHQNGSPRWYLATIESIHQFFVELHSLGHRLNNHTTGMQDSDQPSVHEVSNYNGEYDNLLFFFRFMYEKIHSLYDHDLLYSYKRPVNI